MAAQTARLLFSCPDRKGIIAAVADFMVLATAVRHYVEDKVLVNQNRTVVFD